MTAKPERIDHDQNFKQLIPDFALQAIRFLGAEEGKDVPDDAVITPLRQEQLKIRLKDGHRAVDTALMVKLPKGGREAFVTLVEEETEPRDFSITRLGTYILKMCELHRVTRIVPIVIFLRPGAAPSGLTIGTERATYLTCRYLACRLAEMNALEFLESDNVVARILLPCMKVPKGQRVEVTRKALEGLVTLTPDAHRRRKYAEFVTTYAGLNDGQRVQLKRAVERTHWGRRMGGWFSEAEAKGEARGIRKGVARGRAEGAAEMVLRACERRGLKLTQVQEKTIRDCTDRRRLQRWFDRALSATSAKELFGRKLSSRATSH